MSQEIKIFFSWQSDIKDNAKHIRSSFKAAFKKLNKKEEFKEFKFILDEATSNKSGAVPIVSTILEKIEQSHFFIADVTLCTNNLERKSPNPNVLFETGYAVSALGWEKVNLIFNETYGFHDDMPFDIRGNRLSAWKNDEQLNELIFNILKSSMEKFNNYSLIDNYKNELYDKLNNHNYFNNENYDEIKNAIESLNKLDISEIIRINIRAVELDLMAKDSIYEATQNSNLENWEKALKKSKYPITEWKYLYYNTSLKTNKKIENNYFSSNILYSYVLDKYSIHQHEEQKNY